MIRKFCVRKKGFTLIELLVVIAIIALLMSILMPSLSRVRRQAKNLVCQTNLRQWGIMFTMYTGDNDSRFPGGWSTAHQEQGWLSSLFEYYKSTPDILLCPTGSKAYAGDVTFARWQIWEAHFPADKVTSAFREYITSRTVAGSYGINWNVCDLPSDSSNTTGGNTINRGNFWRTPDVKGASEIPLLLDCLLWIARPMSIDEPPEYRGAMSVGLGLGRYCMDRHDGYINSVHVDGGVSKIGLKELWKKKWHRSWVPVEPDWPEWMVKFKDYQY
jgi:prepilin-type N-terminal cleavage/methylation domain-containing protein